MDFNSSFGRQSPGNTINKLSAREEGEKKKINSLKRAQTHFEGCKLKTKYVKGTLKLLSETHMHTHTQTHLTWPVETPGA